MAEESVVRNQCGRLFSSAEPVQEVRKSVQSCFTFFVFHAYGSLVRNQCLTSAGIIQQCGTSAEPVRNESYVDITGLNRALRLSLFTYLQLVRNQCETSAVFVD